MEVKIMCDLNEVRPDLLRKAICIVYFPIAVPLLFVIGLCLSAGIGIVDTWSTFIVPCWKGTRRIPESKWIGE